MSNREFPMMPWFPQDFSGATSAWTFVERALYRCLLDAQWVLGRLPNDPKRLAIIAGLDWEQFQSAWEQVSTKFELIDEHFVNVRLEEHREKSRSHHAQKVAAGKASAAKRTFNGRSTDVATQVQHPSSSSSTSKEEIRATTRKPKKKATDTRMPDDWGKLDEHRTYAEQHLPDVDAEALAETIRSTALAKAWSYANWNQHWQTLVRQWAPNSGHWSSGQYPRKVVQFRKPDEELPTEFRGMKWT